jgi:hypothetical protein
MSTTFLVYGDGACLDEIEKELKSKGINTKRMLTSFASEGASAGPAYLQLSVTALTAIAAIICAIIRSRRVRAKFRDGETEWEVEAPPEQLEEALRLERIYFSVPRRRRKVAKLKSLSE